VPKLLPDHNGTVSLNGRTGMAYLSQVDGSAVTVIKSNAVKHPGRVGNVALHVFPEKRTVGGTVTVT